MFFPRNRQSDTRSRFLEMINPALRFADGRIEAQRESGLKASRKRSWTQEGQGPRSALSPWPRRTTSLQSLTGPSAGSPLGSRCQPGDSSTLAGSAAWLGHGSLRRTKLLLKGFPGGARKVRPPLGVLGKNTKCSRPFMMSWRYHQILSLVGALD